MKNIYLIIILTLSSISFGQNKKEQIEILNLRLDSLKMVVLSANNYIALLDNHGDSLSKLLQTEKMLNQEKLKTLYASINTFQKQIDEVNTSKKLSEIELQKKNEKFNDLLLKNNELEEASKVFKAQLSQVVLSTDKMKIFAINKTNFNLNVPYIEDTTIVFKLNSEDFELKILRNTVNKDNTRLDEKDENFNLYSNITVCIQKNGEIKYLLETECTEHGGASTLKNLSSGKVILNLTEQRGGSGSKTNFYSIAQNVNNIELNFIFNLTELDFNIFAKDKREIIVMEAIRGEGESHFAPHIYQLKLYNAENGSYDVIGKTKNKYNYDEMLKGDFDAHNALNHLKHKEPNIFSRVDLSRFL
jgi:hypothetical protein